MGFLPFDERWEITTRCCTVADCTRSGLWRVWEIPRIGVPKPKGSVRQPSLYSDTFLNSNLRSHPHTITSHFGKFRTLHQHFLLSEFMYFVLWMFLRGKSGWHLARGPGRAKFHWNPSDHNFCGSDSRCGSTQLPKRWTSFRGDDKTRWKLRRVYFPGGIYSLFVNRCRISCI